MSVSIAETIPVDEDSFIRCISQSVHGGRSVASAQLPDGPPRGVHDAPSPRVAGVDELPGGLCRVTMPLPTRPGHVHCYLLPVDGGFMLVDTGLGLPDAAERWAAELEQLDAPGRRDLPDALPPRPPRGGCRRPRAHRQHGSYQGRVDAAAGRARVGERRVVGRARRLVPARTASPRRSREELDRAGARGTGRSSGRSRTRARRRRRRARRLGARRPRPGHADGQLTLLKDGVLIAADHLLAPDHAHGRALAREPARSARRLSRRARADDRARARDRLRRPRRHRSPTRSGGLTS